MNILLRINPEFYSVSATNGNTSGPLTTTFTQIPPQSKSASSSNNYELPEMQFNITKYDEHEQKKFLELLGDTKNCYSMKNFPRGRAVIINIMHAGTDNERKGSEYDVTNLTKLFKNLWFEVDVYKDGLSADKIKKKLEDESKHKGHKNANAFILCIMSHGKNGQIVVQDNGTIKMEEIINQFNGINCQDLVGKPKLFIVQACRSDPDGASLGHSFLAVNQKGKEKTDTSNHPLEDIMIMYSTVENYTALRFEEYGSLFIRSLVKIFSEFAYCYSLSELDMFIREDVGKYETNTNEVQLSQLVTHAKKNFYFFPGHKTM